MSDPVTSSLAVLPDLGIGVGGRQVALPPRTGRLLAFLALEPVRHTRGAVATALWPDAHPERAFASLRAAVFGLAAPLRELVVAGAALELGSQVEVDLRVATRRAVRLLTDDDLVPDADTLRMLGHDVLAGWSEEWLTCHQVRWAHLRAQALEASVERFSRRHLHGLAVDAALAARDSDPLRETAHLALVRAHAAQGNRYQAIEAYRCYARMLDTELGIAPQVPLADLIEPDVGRQVSRSRQLVGTGQPPG